jgi:hypothetical protein
MGLTIETETWQQRKVLMNKINTYHTYPAVTNYWTPLEDDNKDKKEEEIKSSSKQT